MPQKNISNTEIIGRLLKSTYNIISRRTSESYASVVIRSSVEKLEKKYEFVSYIQIKGVQYKETFDVIDIDEEIDKVDSNILGNAISDFFVNISGQMGSSAGYYFLKEIKEDLPFQYEETIKEYGVDLDYLQLDFMTTKKETFSINITNLDVLKYTYKAIFIILEEEIGRSNAYLELDAKIEELRNKFDVFNYLSANDIRYVQKTNILNINNSVNGLDPDDIATAIQVTIKEVNKILGEKGGFRFIQKLKSQLNSDYLFKLESIGVDIESVEIGLESLVKNILKTIIDIICDFSTKNYAFMIVEQVIGKYSERYPFLNSIKIKKEKYSDNLNWINITKNINSIRPAELGRGIQKIIETIVMGLGDEAGESFVDKFRKKIGKANLVKVEEIGINLHMIQLKKNFIG